ncbi:hypothetical protein CEXT_260571 [Caerostris extrusa]|uniref:Uncharacterized protein n=1 Tax=Caerostris extrusa TaxID=172846 RepID=A0AAV4UFL5_CAEEX|nr:hypothetical protein CEXT_260571 [Caerostris extrusa]
MNTLHILSNHHSEVRNHYQNITCPSSQPQQLPQNDNHLCIMACLVPSSTSEFCQENHQFQSIHEDSSVWRRFTTEDFSHSRHLVSNLVHFAHCIVTAITAQLKLRVNECQKGKKVSLVMTECWHVINVINFEKKRKKSLVDED